MTLSPCCGYEYSLIRGKCGKCGMNLPLEFMKKAREEKNTGCEKFRDLEERVAAIEAWVDFWETIPTPWKVKKNRHGK